MGLKDGVLDAVDPAVGVVDGVSKLVGVCDEVGVTVCEVVCNGLLVCVGVIVEV